MDTPQEPPPPTVDLTAGDPLAGLLRWAAAGRVDEAARERAKERWLEHQAGEEATVAGVLLDLAERSRPIGVTTRGGRRVRGRVVMLGADFVVLRDPAGDAIVPFAALVGVRAAPGEPPPTGDRLTGLEVVLAEALSELAAERPSVRVAAGPDDVRGELRSAGFDVIAVALDTATRDVVHVPIAAVDHLLLPSPPKSV